MRVAWAGGLVLAACSVEPAFLSSEGLASVVLVTRLGNAVTAEALPAPDDDSAIRREIDEGSEVVALGYADSLTALGLRAGPLPLSSAGVALPVPARVSALEEGAWRALDAMPAAVANLRITPTHACATFTWTRVELPPAENDAVTALVPLDLDRLFMATALGRFFLLEGGVATAVALSTTTPHALGARAGGEVWLVGADGSVVHGDPSRGFRAGPPLPAGLTIAGARLTGPEDDAQATELFMLDAELRVAHFEGTRWRLLRDMPLALADHSRLSIAWASPGVAMATGARYDGVEVVRARDGVISFDVLDLPPRTSGDTTWNVVNLDTHGVVVGTRNNVMFSREQDTWRRWPIPPTNPRADVMVSLGGGRFVSGGENSFFVAWDAMGESCDASIVPVGGGVYRVARTREGFVAVASAGRDYMVVAWVREVP